MPSHDLMFLDVEASSLRPYSLAGRAPGCDGLFAQTEDAGKRLIEPYLPLLVDKIAERSVPCVSL